MYAFAGASALRYGRALRLATAERSGSSVRSDQSSGPRAEVGRAEVRLLPPLRPQLAVGGPALLTLRAFGRARACAPPAQKLFFLFSTRSGSA